MPNDPESRPLSVAVCLSSLGLLPGGLETTIARLATALAARGLEVVVVSGRDPGEALPRSVSRLTVPCIPFTDTRWNAVRRRRPGWPLLAQSIMFLAGCRARADVRRAIGGADVSLTALEAETVAISRWRARRGGPNVSLFPGVIDARRLARDRSAVRLAVSRALADRAAEAGSPTVDDVILAGPPAEWLALPYEPRDDARSLLFVGRLEPNKGVHELLDIFAALRPASAGLRLRIVGDGPLRPEVYARLRAGALEPYVQLTGPLPNATVLDAMREADLFVFPSRQESFSQALLEAMAAGLPVVASDVDGNREAAEGAACLLPIEDLDAWVTTIRSLLSDAPARRRLSGLGRQRARDLAGDGAVERLEQWLHRAVTRGPG